MLTVIAVLLIYRVHPSVIPLQHPSVLNSTLFGPTPTLRWHPTHPQGPHSAVHLPNLLGACSGATLIFDFRTLHILIRDAPLAEAAALMTKPKAPQGTAHAALGCGVVLKSSVAGSSALARRTTHLTWFPIKHAQPAETYSPGATWRRSVPFWGYPDLALAYFTFSLVDPFGKPGWHAAVCAAARPRPALGMERAATCGCAEEPSPCPTRLHISAGYPSGFLSCFQSNHPQT